MLYFAVHMAMYMLPFFPRSIELRSQRLERQPIPLWPEDYEEGMAILMHIGIENRFGYLNRFFRKGEGRRKNDGLAGYSGAIPKSFRMSAIPKTSLTCHLRWIELLSRTFVPKTTTEGEVSDRIVALDTRRRASTCPIRLYYVQTSPSRYPTQLILIQKYNPLSPT
jgi:hypothetical protein